MPTLRERWPHSHPDIERRNRRVVFVCATCGIPCQRGDVAIADLIYRGQMSSPEDALPSTTADRCVCSGGKWCTQFVDLVSYSISE